MIDVTNFHPNLLKIDKKSHRNFDIYFIGYNMISNCNFDCDWYCDYENIRSVKSLYLIIHSATWYFKERYDEKYLILDSVEKYEEVFSGIKSEIETINGGKELFHEKNYSRIGVNTNDDVPLNKPLKFSTLTVTIRCVFQKGEELYPPLYLDECFYESV